MVLLPRLQIFQKCFLNLEALMVTKEMSTIDAMEEQVSQMQTKSEVATSLLESWSLAMKTFMQDFKSILTSFIPYCHKHLLNFNDNEKQGLFCITLSLLAKGE